MAADQALVDQLQERFGDGIVGAQLEAIDPWIEVRADRLVEMVLYLRDQCERRFDLLNCMSGVDYFQPDPKKAAKTPWQPHLELVYHLSSTITKERLVLKVMLPRWQDDVAGQLPTAPAWPTCFGPRTGTSGRSTI